MEELFSYVCRIAFGFVLALLLIRFIPAKEGKLLHLMIFLLLFIFIRDAMTPEGLWQFGGEGFFWIRFTSDPLLLSLLGIISVGIVLLMNALSPALAESVVWFSRSKRKGILVGIIAAVLVAAPLILIYQGVAIAERGGTFAVSLLPFLLILTLGGNLYEEVLFRGYLQGILEKDIALSPIKAAVISGLFFSLGHLFLAYTVTSTGYPLLLFAAFEGIVAGVVRMRYGVIPATLTHGGAIFLLSSGIF